MVTPHPVASEPVPPAHEDSPNEATANPNAGPVLGALDQVVAALQGGGEQREGQRQMAIAVADAISSERPLVCQAGTGTGKSLAYLVPIILSGKRTVIATATKTLQDQLAEKDLPMLAATLDVPFSHCVLKGRSNYLCRQRLVEMERDGGGEQLDLTQAEPTRLGSQVTDLLEWAAVTTTGDRAELAFEPDERVWSAVSVTSDECPGASRCPSGEECFAEDARAAAAVASIVVVNLHLYGLHLVVDGGVLPEHEVVVIDEAHQLEDVLSAVAGVTLTPGRFTTLARAARAALPVDDDANAVADAGERLGEVLVPLNGRRIADADPDLDDALDLARSRVEALGSALRAADDDASDDHQAALRLIGRTGALLDSIDLVRHRPASHVAWVEGGDRFPTLRSAPVDVGGLLDEQLWGQHPVVMTSATLSPDFGTRMGLPSDDHDHLDVGSPFDYDRQALLYCAMHLPDPPAPGYRDAVVDELTSLVTAARGRTLALFTSWRALGETADLLAERIDHPILRQGELPKGRLIEEFTESDETVLMATLGFWQGVDIPGSTLSLVTIDRIPFPRPDEPLLQARRDRAGPSAFGTVDLPRAATMLAQGAGRLIRTATDRGVVAVLDPRLGKANYRWALVNALPPMARTRHLADAVAFLEDLTGGG